MDWVGGGVDILGLLDPVDLLDPLDPLDLGGVGLVWVGLVGVGRE